MTKAEEHIKGKTIVISIHVSTTGPGHDLREYLLLRGAKRLLFIAHPLLFFKENVKHPSRFELYEDGKLVKEGVAFHIALPEHILYIKDFFLSLYWAIRIIGRHDIYIGVGNLNAFAGVILKWLGICREVIYYVIDFVPKRFASSVINSLYHWIEKEAALRSSWTWNLSPRMIDGREQKWKLKFPNQLVVPHGVHVERIRRTHFANINKHELIYMGTLLEKQGIQMVIAALPEIRKTIKDVSFTVIGRGPYSQELKRLVKKYQVEDTVHFLGYIENHREMEDRLAKSAITVALYDKKTDIFSYYADPGKIKNYLGAGVPVIMTDVPYVAHEVVANNCGFLIDYKKEALIETVVKYFKNEAMQKEFRDNAVRFAKKYEWSMIFDSAFSHE